MFFGLFTFLFSENEEKLVSLDRPISQVAQSQSPFVSQVPQTTSIVFPSWLERTFTKETLSHIQAKIPLEFGAPTRTRDRVSYLCEVQWIDLSGNNYVKLNEGDFLSRFPPLLPHEISKHVRIKINGRVIGRGGKVIRVTSTTPIPENTLEARIPLDEWLNWRFFDNPGDTSNAPAAATQSTRKSAQAAQSSDEPSGSGQQDPNDPRKPKPSKESAPLPVPTAKAQLPVREGAPVYRDSGVGGGELSSGQLGRIQNPTKAGTQYKVPKPGISGKEGAKNPPSWAKGHRPKIEEDGNQFATRLMDEKYGQGNYDKGPSSEYNQIQKWGDRAFVKPTHPY